MFSRLLIEKNVMVPMSDGTRLATDVYRPESDAPVATLLQRTPYDKDVSSFHNFTLEISKLVEAGYAVVVQDVRGRFRSEGRFEPFVDEGADGAVTVEWIADQVWSNGQVGMFGASYYGATQWLAVQAGGGVGAIAPCFTSGDMYQGWAHHGGAFRLGVNLNWVLSVLAPGELVRRIGAGEDALADLEALVNAVDDDAGTYALTPLDASPLMSRVAPYYADWLRNPEPGSYWDRRDAVTDRAASTPSLSIGGWYDIFLAGTIDGYLTAAGGPAGGRSRLVIGPWAHGNMSGQFPERSFGFGSHYQALDPTDLHLRWFDEQLRERPSNPDEAPVRMFVMGADEWWDAPSWPLPGTEYRSYFLRPSAEGPGSGPGTLADAPLLRSDAHVAEYRYDPNDPVPTVGGATFLPGFLVSANAGPRDQAVLDDRSDVLTFVTEPLETDLAVVGPVELVLHVSSSAPDTDFTGKLVDVHPDGTAVILTDGVMRARYRDGFDRPADLVPGEVYELRVDLVATANVFRRGHRVRVDVSSSNFPKYDRNLNTGGKNAEESIAVAVIAENRVHLGPDTPSRLVLPCTSANNPIGGQRG